MQRFDQTSATCRVFTYKEGLLSSLAHDLRIDVTKFVLDLGDGDHFVRGRFDARSLRVDCAMVDGVPRPDLLSTAERAEINANITREVLDADKFGEIFLDSSSILREDSGYRVTGRLIIRGITKDISFQVRRNDGNFVVDVGLHLPDFGIRPFSALFGAVRIRPDILIRVEIPVGLIDKDFLL